MRQLVGLRTDQIVGPVNTTAARPAAAGDGVDITAWRSAGIFLDPLVQVFIDTTLAGNLTSPTGGAEGVELWGYQPKVNAWYMIALLNKGQQINLPGVSQGYSEVIPNLGDYARLHVAGTASAGAPLFHVGPMESWTY